MNLTQSGGGPEPDEFVEKLAAEIIKGWKHFRDVVWPNVRPGHYLYHYKLQKIVSAFNDAFYDYQKSHFDSQEQDAIENGIKDMHASTCNIFFYKSFV